MLYALIHFEVHELHVYAATINLYKQISPKCAGKTNHIIMYVCGLLSFCIIARVYQADKNECGSGELIKMT